MKGRSDTMHGAWVIVSIPFSMLEINAGKPYGAYEYSNMSAS